MSFEKMNVDLLSVFCKSKERTIPEELTLQEWFKASHLSLDLQKTLYVLIMLMGNTKIAKLDTLNLKAGPNTKEECTQQNCEE